MKKFSTIEKQNSWVDWVSSPFNSLIERTKGLFLESIKSRVKHQIEKNVYLIVKKIFNRAKSVMETTAKKNIGAAVDRVEACLEKEIGVEAQSIMAKDVLTKDELLQSIKSIYNASSKKVSDELYKSLAEVAGLLYQETQEIFTDSTKSEFSQVAKDVFEIVNESFESIMDVVFSKEELQGLSQYEMLEKACLKILREYMVLTTSQDEHEIIQSSKALNTLKERLLIDGQKGGSKVLDKAIKPLLMLLENDNVFSHSNKKSEGEAKSPKFTFLNSIATKVKGFWGMLVKPVSNAFDGIKEKYSKSFEDQIKAEIQKEVAQIFKEMTLQGHKVFTGTLLTNLENALSKLQGSIEKKVVLEVENLLENKELTREDLLKSIKSIYHRSYKELSADVYEVFKDVFSELLQEAQKVLGKKKTHEISVVKDAILEQVQGLFARTASNVLDQKKTSELDMSLFEKASMKVIKDSLTAYYSNDKEVCKQATENLHSLGMKFLYDSQQSATTLVDVVASAALDCVQNNHEKKKITGGRLPG